MPIGSRFSVFAYREISALMTAIEVTFGAHGHNVTLSDETTAFLRALHTEMGKEFETNTIERK